MGGKVGLIPPFTPPFKREIRGFTHLRLTFPVYDTDELRFESFSRMYYWALDGDFWRVWK